MNQRQSRGHRLHAGAGDELALEEERCGHMLFPI
jgi:hypothetical protein